MTYRSWILPMCAALAAVGCSSSTKSPVGSAESADSGGLTVSSALTLSQSSASAGDTVTATVVYTNTSGSSYVVQTGVIAARPPGGTHTGGPYDDFQPDAAATTVAPGATFTVTATRTFAAGDPTGQWDLYPTYQDSGGTWHDGADIAFSVGVPPTPTESASCTTIAQGGSITDGAGNTWTLQGGVVDENAAPAGYSKNVTTLAYVNHVVSQENADDNWWSWTNGGWSAESDPTTSCGSTPPVGGAVNGACGSGNDQALASAPTTNLCSAGTASALSGMWSWSCAGSGGGTTASCQTAGGAGAPSPAAAAGYTTLTFGPPINLATTPSPTTSFPQFSNGANWAPFTFFGTSWTTIGAAQNFDGSVTMDGTGQLYGNGLSTAVVGTTPSNWTGMAFGGGGYFQATMAFDGPASFWANDVENMAMASTSGQSTTPSWIEADMAEFDSTGVYGFALHNWTSTANGGQGISTLDSGSPVSPPGADFTKPNKFGFLWVPATATSQGYAQWFFNDVQVGNTITWNQFDPNASPASNPYSVMDSRHLALILGASPGTTDTIYDVQVWQSSSASDITQ